MRDPRDAFKSQNTGNASECIFLQAQGQILKESTAWDSEPLCTCEGGSRTRVMGWRLSPSHREELSQPLGLPGE